MRQARQQWAAVEAIESLGGYVFYDYQWPDSNKQSPTSAWLRRLCGDDVFANVKKVYLGGRKITDADLQCLCELAHLEELTLDGTQVTDTGLQQLRGLTRLKHLSLNDTKLTGTGFEYFKGLTQLQGVWLDQTQVTDAGRAASGG